MSSSPRPRRIALGNMLVLFSTRALIDLVEGLRFRIMNSHFQKHQYHKVAESSRRRGVAKNPLQDIYFEGFFEQFPESLFQIAKVRGRYVSIERRLAFPC